MRSWIPALRVARREARRAKGRSALVVAMIGLPVLLLSFAAATYDMHDLRPGEQLDRTMGQADARLSKYFDGPLEQNPTDEAYSAKESVPLKAPVTAESLLAVLPPGSRLTRVADAPVDLRTPSGIGTIDGHAVDLAEPMLRGLVNLVSGTVPQHDDEVAIDAAASDRLGVGIGGTVRTVSPDRTFKVTALVEFPDSLSGNIAFRPGQVVSGGAWLVDTPSPLTWPDVQKLNQQGIVALSRAVVLDPPATPPLFQVEQSSQGDQITFSVIVFGLVVLEVVLLAGPAFAVGARRRRRDLALVAAAGGTPGHLRRIVLADGVVLGALAAVGGVLGGMLLAVLLRPLVEQYLVNARAGAVRLFLPAQAALIVLSVGTGLLAAMVPAFTAARQDVVTVLAGRRGVTRSRKRWIALGLVMAAAGAVIAIAGAASSMGTTTILTGVIVGELGLVLLTPALVGLISRLGRWLPLAPRIALRDTARNRGSAAPAISAVMAAVAGAVAIGAFVGSERQHSIDVYDPVLPVGNFGVRYAGGDADKHTDWARLRSAVQRIVPQARLHPYQGVTCAWQTLPDPAASPAPSGTPQPAPSGTPAPTPTPTTQPDTSASTRQCGIEMFLPVANRCPFQQYQTDDGRDWDAMAADPRCGDQGYNEFTFMAVDDGDALAALSGASADDIAAARRVLAAGGVVVTNPLYLVDGKVALSPINGEFSGDPDTLQTTSVPGMVIGGTGGFTVMVPPALAQRLGFGLRPDGFVADGQTPDGAQVEAIGSALHELAERDTVGLIVENGPSYREEPIIWILGLIAAMVALGAAGVATGLAAADSRADLVTLAAVGASPRVRRTLSLSQSGVISGLGALLGVLAGLGTAYALILALNSTNGFTVSGRPLHLVMPWSSLAIVMAVPLIAMAGAGLLTRSRLPSERRL
ncbi:hypothetical protein Cs7R123_71070 [Catellatospora sp. TT07R-123]|uniref:ABC transporter permease n=1 Tax=Catellatospora sp. TT07R-123 TaxID=2733863 RepID=UPI001B0DE31B|nr:ABC transporter permease [Catellatospora sp. TT07R-123]GHJ49765.1 hypothetical protein Cs7R123_71070 [Catellatospora sp. TT07R-123]